MGDQRFPPAFRVCRAADFQRIYNRRCVVSDEKLVLFGCANDLPHTRLGLSVSRKLGNAVFRNRWKRLIREAFRISHRQLPTGIDLVVIPRQGIEPELAEVLKSLPRLAARVALKLNR